jgi:FAD/FMN-containing dehydrogenase
VQQALALLREVRAGAVAASTAGAPRRAQPGSAGERRTRGRSAQDHTLRASWKRRGPRAAASEIFAGARLRPVLDECEAHPPAVLRGRVFVALHMHAGDGNVHTNIPVNSDNYAMLQTAHEAVARIMALARAARAA